MNMLSISPEIDMESYWYVINISSGNGLVLSDNKP